MVPGDRVVTLRMAHSGVLHDYSSKEAPVNLDSISFNTPFFQIGGTPVTLATLISLVLILLAAIWLSRGLQRLLTRMLALTGVEDGRGRDTSGSLLGPGDWIWGCVTDSGDQPIGALRGRSSARRWPRFRVPEHLAELHFGRDSPVRTHHQTRRHLGDRRTCRPRLPDGLPVDSRQDSR